MRAVLLSIVIGSLVGCREPARREVPPAAGAPRELVNLRALARLYGVVRWFHPTDEAAAIDWDRYAVAGVRAVRGAADDAALARALTSWIAPIGPAVQVVTRGEALRPFTVPPGSDQVAWQHLGPGFDGGQEGVYQSRRTRRAGRVDNGATWGVLTQVLDATALRGRRVRLRGQVRAGQGARVGLWLRVDRAGADTGFFDNMMDRAITAPSWTEATIEGPVAGDAIALAFGGLASDGEGWFDAFRLDVDDGRGGWTAVPVTNPDLDDGLRGWSGGQPRAEPAMYALDLAPAARDGGAAAHVGPPSTAPGPDLFAERPAPGEVVEVDLGSGLRAQVPISLATVDDHTVPAGDPAEAEAVLATVAAAGVDHADVRIADIVVAWGALAHFYPYLDVVDRPWSQVLDESLAEDLRATTVVDHRDALRHLIVALEDGHGAVLPGAAGFLPLRLAAVDRVIVVTRSGDDDVAPGDVLVAIDGAPAGEAVAAMRGLISGSPQWRAFLALVRVGEGEAGTEVRLTVERDGARREVTVVRGVPPAPTGPAIAEVRPGVWLVDLARAPIADLEARAAVLASARGVIFDLRGYPAGNHGVLAHLLPAAEHDRWMHVARVIRPNLPGAAPPTWTSAGWDLAPVEPRYAGKVVFLTGPGAISYAESVMGYVEALGLPIVGGTTAGANGNVRMVSLPSGARFVFTGMKVTRHDGTPSHTLGIRPTVPVEPTLAGLREGKDEVLERALALVDAP